MKVFYDQNQVRYTLVCSKKGSDINWLFIPGGPGGDSSYFLDLIELLNLTGNTWCIDLPGNGNHTVQKDNFDNWLSIFVPILQGFQHPVIVGHSFGGMLPLLFRECEKLLKGLVILNSAPCLWLEAAIQYAKEHELPDLSFEMQEFTQKPNQETFNKALEACMPYYFPSETLELGRKLLSKVPFSFEPAVWWQRKAIEISYNANWIPKSVKTLIIGAEFDAITPFSLFEKDKRFDRANIEKLFIKGAGHLPWVEKPEEVQDAFQKFLLNL